MHVYNTVKESKLIDENKGPDIKIKSAMRSVIGEFEKRFQISQGYISYKRLESLKNNSIDYPKMTLPLNGTLKSSNVNVSSIEIFLVILIIHIN